VFADHLDAGPLVRPDLGDRATKHLVDVRPAGRIDERHGGDGLLDRLRRDGGEAGLEALDEVAEPDDGEAVVRVQVAQDEREGALRLIDLLAAHAPRPIEHEDQVLGERLRRGGRVGGRRDEEEEPVLARRVVAEEGHPHLRRRCGVVEEEVVGREDVERFVVTSRGAGVRADDA
jgi:hypothetical protein